MPSSQWVFDPFRLDPANACLWCDAVVRIAIGEVRRALGDMAQTT